jgi:hypothetical protein
MDRFVIKRKQNVEDTLIINDVNVINSGGTSSKASYIETQFK